MHRLQAATRQTYQLPVFHPILLNSLTESKNHQGASLRECLGGLSYIRLIWAQWPTLNVVSTTLCTEVLEWLDRKQLAESILTSLCFLTRFNVTNGLPGPHDGLTMPVTVSPDHLPQTPLPPPGSRSLRP